MGTSKVESNKESVQHGSTPRILFAVFQTGNLANGGVESISNVIDSIGSECVVVTQMDTDVNRRWEDSGKQVELFKLPYRVGNSFKGSNILQMLKRMGSLVATNWRTICIIRKHRLQVLHCNDPAPFWHVVPAAMITRIPVVLNLRDTKSSEETTSRSKYLTKFRFCNVVLVLSNEMAEFYQQLIGPTSLQKINVKIQAIYSIVDFERMKKPDSVHREEIKSKLGINEQQWSIGFVAAFNDKKNQLEFIQKAGPELWLQVPEAKTFFIGDYCPENDAYAESCRIAIDSLDEQKYFECVGFTNEVSEWYQALDLVVVPTRKEGMARCMIEALACGTPVVSFDVCSANEILFEHQCGIVVPQGDYHGLIEAVTSLLRNEQERVKLGNNGCVVANELFLRDHILDQYEQLYSMALKNQASVHH